MLIFPNVQANAFDNYVLNGNYVDSAIVDIGRDLIVTVIGNFSVY
mgnify:CR=1 FL=1